MISVKYCPSLQPSVHPVCLLRILSLTYRGILEAYHEPMVFSQPPKEFFYSLVSIDLWFYPN